MKGGTFTFATNFPLTQPGMMVEQDAARKAGRDGQGGGQVGGIHCTHDERRYHRRKSQGIVD